MSSEAVIQRRRMPISVAGLGPHGETATSVDMLELLVPPRDAARAEGYTVAIVMHTTQSDYARKQLAGIRSTLEEYGATVIEVVDCEFSADQQVATLERLAASPPGAIISLPVDNVLTADAHRMVSQAGIKLVLMDNAPVGLLAEKDYVSLVSADNFGNGQVAAVMLSMYVRNEGRVAMIGYDADYFAVNERELGFRRAMSERRPDVSLRRQVFLEPERAGEAVRDLIANDDPIDGVFVVWDDPAMAVVRTLREVGHEIPMTTVDLGYEAAMEVADGRVIKGISAQLPYDQGRAEALAAVVSLSGGQPPPWVALPGPAVTRQNLLDAYERVWHEPAPDELRRAASAPSAEQR
jgi:ribose transport system substrate-binding protein